MDCADVTAVARRFFRLIYRLALARSNGEARRRENNETRAERDCTEHFEQPPG